MVPRGTGAEVRCFAYHGICTLFISEPLFEGKGRERKFDNQYQSDRNMTQGACGPASSHL